MTHGRKPRRPRWPAFVDTMATAKARVALVVPQDITSITTPLQKPTADFISAALASQPAPQADHIASAGKKVGAVDHILDPTFAVSQALTNLVGYDLYPDGTMYPVVNPHHEGEWCKFAEVLKIVIAMRKS